MAKNRKNGEAGKSGAMQGPSHKLHGCDMVAAVNETRPQIVTVKVNLYEVIGAPGVDDDDRPFFQWQLEGSRYATYEEAREAGRKAARMLSKLMPQPVDGDRD